MQHTPTPWRMVGRCGQTIEGQGRFVADAYGDTLAEGEANARLIVRAVNAHDDLVAACDMIANHHCVSSRGGSYTMALTADEVAQIRAALGKATA